MSMKSSGLRGAIMDCMDDLNEDELHVLHQVAQGLAHGRQVYGPLDIGADRRDMVKETLEEVRDALVYVGVKLVQINE